MGYVWANITYPSIAHVAPIRCHFPNFYMGPMWECNNLPSGINIWVMYGPHITCPLIAHVAPIRCHFPNFNMGPMWECNNLPSGIPTICPHGYHVHGCLGQKILLNGFAFFNWSSFLKGFLFYLDCILCRTLNFTSFHLRRCWKCPPRQRLWFQYRYS